MSTIYTLNGKVLKNSANDKWLIMKEAPDYNPLGLPPNTVRVRTSDGNAPARFPYEASLTTYETATLVPGTTNVYDVYKSGTSFNGLLLSSSNVIEVLGANTTGITNMYNMFGNESGFTVPLTSVALFDTSSVTNMSGMFAGCSSLTSVPLFDTSSVTDMSWMLNYCANVQSGALALYQQASSQSNPPASHDGAFTNCGSNTVTGAAELAQIPSSWGGTGA
jgi:surface protein